ncbi:hypothetical protein NFI96_021349, partial [Prochilodus magdalenae]
VRVIGRSVTVTAGEDATLFCQLVDSKEKLTRITWQKKTRRTLINKDFFVITPDGRTENKNGLGDRVQFIGNIQETIGTILLKKVTLLDEGVYTCIINISPSGPFEAASDLNIQAPPVVSVTTDVIPVVGESEVTLATCTAATAKPEADVSWDLGALSDSVKVKNILSEDPDGTSTVTSYLIGVPSKDLNQQKVRCLVKHTSLNKELVLDHALVVHYPPQHVSIIPSKNTEFQCVVDANPQPTVFTWTRVNKSLPGHADGSSLKVPLTSDNNGLYLCSVSNQYGNASGTLYLHYITGQLHSKLTQLNVPVSTCQWITNFPTGREQQVRLGTIISRTKTTTTGAPQGCVLSPWLFSLYTNDCTSVDPSVKILKFADEMTDIGLIRDDDESAYRQTVGQLVLWSNHNNLKLNTAKTVEMTVDFRRGPLAIPPLTILDRTVMVVESHRFLAVRVIGRSVTVTAGEDATLFCQLVDSREKLTRITWQKKTRGTLINKDFFDITPDGRTENKNGLGDRVQFIGNIQEIIGTILLKDVILLDEGVYTCVINISPSGPFEEAIDLNIQVPPVVSVTTDVIPVVGDSEVTLATCTAATAKPAADVSWDLGALSNSVKVKRIFSEDPDGTSTVKSYLIGVPSKDLNQQKVQCLVKHSSLNKELVLDHALVVHYPPQFVYIISRKIKDPATFQEFQCVVDANPQPTVFTWTRVNKSLPGHADGSSLKVPLTSDSNGLYLCSVSNQYGNGTDTLYFHHVTGESPLY